MSRTDRVTPSINRVGSIPVPVNQGIYEESVTQKAPLGTRMDLGDGRVFYYAKNSTAATNLCAGKLVGSAIIATQREDAISAAILIGAKEFTFEDQSIGIAADQYAEGYLTSVDHTGEGQTYKIRGNEAISSGESGTFWLYDPIVTALDTTSDIIVAPNPFYGTILVPDDVIFCLGAPLIPVNTSYYYWVQTWGPIAILINDSKGGTTPECQLTVDAAGQADGGARCVATSGVPGAQTIGYNIFDSTNLVATEYHLVYLTCLP